MLQRSPTYVVSLPVARPRGRVAAAPAAQRWPPTVVRWKNVALMTLSYQLSRRRPDLMKSIIRQGAQRQLPDGLRRRHALQARLQPLGSAHVRRPRRRPVRRAISAGRASIVTDQIETFTERGVRLRVAAPSSRPTSSSPRPGCNARPRRHAASPSTARPVDLPDQVVYKGMMLSGVPNFAFAVGYTNASWTLKADLTAAYVCRLLNHMTPPRLHRSACRADEDPAVVREPLLDLTSGYVLRSVQDFPKQGSKRPGGCTRTTPWMSLTSSSAGSTTGSCGSRAVVAPPPGSPGPRRFSRRCRGDPSTGSPLRPPRLTSRRRHDRPCGGQAGRRRGPARPPRRSDLRPSRAAAGRCGHVHRSWRLPYPCAGGENAGRLRSVEERLVPRSLVWATNIDVLAPDRTVRRADGYLVVRSPSNPTFWWGNLLVFDAPPGEGDGQRWEALFEAEFADEPRVAHLTFAWDRTDDERGAADSEFIARGFDLELNVGMIAAPEEIHPIPRANAPGADQGAGSRAGGPDEALWEQVIETPGRRARHRAPRRRSPTASSAAAARASCAGCSRRVSGRGTWPSTVTWWPGRWGSSSPAAAAAIRRWTPPSPTAAAGSAPGSRRRRPPCRGHLRGHPPGHRRRPRVPRRRDLRVRRLSARWSGSAGCAGRLPPIGAPARTARPQRAAARSGPVPAQRGRRSQTGPAGRSRTPRRRRRTAPPPRSPPAPARPRRRRRPAGR